MEKIQVTKTEFQKISGLNNAVEAGSVMNFLVAQGIAKLVGKRKRTRGKPSDIFEIPQTVTLNLFSDSDIPSTTVESETVESETVESETEETVSKV